MERGQDQFPPHEHGGGDEERKRDLFPNGHFAASARRPASVIRSVGIS
jgi:hypothetical protein